MGNGLPYKPTREPNPNPRWAMIAAWVVVCFVAFGVVLPLLIWASRAIWRAALG